MTNPIPVANLRATVDVDASDVRGDLEQELRRAGRDLDDDADDLGEGLGVSIGRGLSRSTRREIDNFESDIGRDLSGALGRLVDLLERIDIGGRGRRRFRRGGEEAAEGFFTGFSGVFGRLSSVITGPLGAFFNVGGRSPLLLLLLPLLGSIIALITALVYGVQALVSQLFLIPSLLFAIGLQATALYLIFDGLGEVIGNAFAAENAQELDEALKGVSSSVADVVRQLILWRDFFRDLRGAAQGAFFGELGTELTDILNNVRGPLAGAISGISASLGNALASALQAFTRPEFAQFLELIGGSTSQWLEGFGKALNTLIVGLTDLGIALDPFLDIFGEAFNNVVAGIGEWLSDLSQDPEFIGWMQDSIPVIRDFVEFLGSLWNLLSTIIEQFAAADQEIQSQGGASFLDTLTTMIMAFVAFLSSESGQDAMRGFIYLLNAMVAAFLLLLTGILFILGVATDFVDWVRELHLEVVAFINGLLGGEGPLGALKRFADALRQGLTDALTAFGEFLVEIGAKILAGIDTVRTNISKGLGEIKDGIVGFFADSWDLLVDAGKNIISGLVRGLKEGAQSNAFLSTLGGIAAKIRGFFPFSPAEEGPLSGQGDLQFAGQEIVNRLAAGIRMETPELAKAVSATANSVNFGPGAVNFVYNGGQPPSRQQADMLGQTAGRSIVEQILTTQLAVRTI